MSAQKKKPTKSMSAIEALEGRQLFSAAPALPGGAPLSDAKVTTQDFSFVMRANKGSPELATTGKVSIHDIPITGKSGSETTGDTGDATLVAARIKLTDLLVS